MNENKGYRRLKISAAVSLVVLCLLGIGSIVAWRLPPPPVSDNSVETPQTEQDRTAHNIAADCNACGVIESIRVETVLGKPSGIGAVAGNGEGSAEPDDETRRGIKQQTNYRILVRMADGTQRKFYSSTQKFTVGQEVKVFNDHLAPYSNS